MPLEGTGGGFGRRREAGPRSVPTESPADSANHTLNGTGSLASKDAEKAERRATDRRRKATAVTNDRRTGKDRRALIKEQSWAVSVGARQPQTEDLPVYVCRDRYAPPPVLQETVERIQETVLNTADLNLLSRLKGDELTEEVHLIVSTVIAQMNLIINNEERGRLVTMLMDDLTGFGPLAPLLNDPRITDIMANGPDKVWIERDGKMMLSDVTFRSTAHLLHVIQRIAMRVNRHIDEASPMVDCRLPDGSRVNAIIPPLAVRTPSLSIRKFMNKMFPVASMVANGTLSPDMGYFLKMASKYRINILVSGGTGTGKTTMLKALTDFFGAAERIVTIEDTAELALELPNLVEMESRPPNAEGAGEVDMRDLLRNALRMRPDRIIVGEVRGPEAGEMLHAMNTGHDGSLGTVHANSAIDAMMRFENMVCMNDRFQPGVITRQQIVSAIQLVVQLSRMQDGTRKVVQISEVLGVDGGLYTLRDLFRFRIMRRREDGTIEGVFEPTLLRPRLLDRMATGLFSDEEQAFIDRAFQFDTADTE